MTTRRAERAKTPPSSLFHRDVFHRDTHDHLRAINARARDHTINVFQWHYHDGWDSPGLTVRRAKRRGIKCLGIISATISHCERVRGVRARGVSTRYRVRATARGVLEVTRGC